MNEEYDEDIIASVREKMTDIEKAATERAARERLIPDVKDLPVSSLRNTILLGISSIQEGGGLQDLCHLVAYNYGEELEDLPLKYLGELLRRAKLNLDSCFTQEDLKDLAENIEGIFDEEKDPYEQHTSNFYNDLNTICAIAAGMCPKCYRVKRSKKYLRKRALQVLAQVYYDINTYERNLGIDWPYTRLEIWEMAKIIMEGLPETDPPSAKELDEILD